MRYAAEEWTGARHFLYAPGNHEFHGADIDRARKRLAEEHARHGITLLDADAIVIDDVNFIDATLWTNLLLDGVGREPGAPAQRSGSPTSVAGSGSNEGPGGPRRSNRHDVTPRSACSSKTSSSTPRTRDRTTAVVVTHQYLA